MQERERIVVSGLVALMLVLWLGFAVHRSPRFAGGPWGGVLGVSGALLMLWPLGYSAVKRIPALKERLKKRLPMRTLLAWHVYTGILGAVLAVLHTGHKFDSPLGVALTASVLVAALTGFVGRYFLGMVSQEMREQRETLGALEAAYRRTAEELAARAAAASRVASGSGPWGRLRTALFAPEEVEGGAYGDDPAVTRRAVRLSESVADLEYAIKSHELLKRRFSLWLKLHVASSVLFYALLALHVWASIHFGLRWFD